IWIEVRHGAISFVPRYGTRVREARTRLIDRTMRKGTRFRPRRSQVDVCLFFCRRDFIFGVMSRSRVDRPRIGPGAQAPTLTLPRSTRGGDRRAPARLHAFDVHFAHCGPTVSLKVGYSEDS